MSRNYPRWTYAYDGVSPAIRVEDKAVRRVRTPEGAEKYGQPIGSVITPDTVPAQRSVLNRARALSGGTTDAGRVRTAGRTVSARKPAAGAATTPPKRPAPKTRLVYNVAREEHYGSTGLQRAYGPEDDTQIVSARNQVSRDDYSVEYVSRAELDKARSIAKAKAKKVNRPADYDIADNKRLFDSSKKGQNISDLIRGDKYQRQANAWQVYLDFGGVDSKGKDKGYVACVGCGVKLSWHNNRAFTKYPKMELDKIIVGADGGQYNPENIVPMCSACNKQRGNKRMWESAVFDGSKPSWYTRTYEARVKAIRPKPRDLKAGEGRPKKPEPRIPMPIPPGQVRVRTS